jgi:RNA polymerase sigma-70 factor (ECF subfamily)
VNLGEDAIRTAASGERWSEAITIALHTYGDELLGYLVAITRDGTLAQDVFSMLLEDLWVGLPRFGWRCTFRTWAYKLARHAVTRQKRSRSVRASVPLDSAIEAIADQIRSRTETFLRSETRDAVAAVRAALDPDDQALLVLRVNRGLSWREIAEVFAEGEDPSDKELTRRAAALRQQFQRIKGTIRTAAEKSRG